MKLSPEALAKEARTFAVGTEEYDYDRQQRWAGAAASPLNVTFRGTRTYESTGKVIDNDNDN